MDREYQLMCLFKNGKDAVVDLFKYFYSNDDVAFDIKEVLQKLKRSVLAITSNNIIIEPERLVEFRKNLQIFVSSNYCHDLDVNKLVERIMLLGLFIARSDHETYYDLEEGDFIVDDFPDLRTWKEFWTYNVEFIVKILSYLNNKNFLDDRKYYQRRLEIEVIIEQESSDSLSNMYLERICSDYDITTTFPRDRHYRRYKKRIEFNVQFFIANLERKVQSEETYWYYFRKKFGFQDMSLTSEFSTKVDYSVTNVFRDRLGDHNDERYSIYMYCCEDDSVKIRGRRSHISSRYEVLFVPPENSYIPGRYNYALAPDTRAYMERYNEILGEVIQKNMGFKTFFGINNWRYVREHVKSAGFLLKNNHREKWTIDELYTLDESLDEAMTKLNDEFDDIKIKSMKPFYWESTGYLNFGFHANIYSLALLDVIENIIPIAQSALMDIESF